MDASIGTRNSQFPSYSGELDIRFPLHRRSFRRDDVVHVLLRHPSESLRDIFEQVACRELQHLRAQALEYLDFWSKRVSLGEATARILAAAASSEFPWLRFLAAVQSARLGPDDGEGWQRAAQEIVASRIPEPMGCIRPQAEEQLSHDERARVDVELRALGAPLLNPSDPQQAP